MHFHRSKSRQSNRQPDASLARRPSETAATTIDNTSTLADTTVASSYSAASARNVLGRASIEARRRSPLHLASESSIRGPIGKATPPPQLSPIANLASAGFYGYAAEQRHTVGTPFTCRAPSTDSFVTTFDQRQSMQTDRGIDGDVHAADVRDRLRSLRLRRPSTIKEHLTPSKRQHLKSKFSVSPRQSRLTSSRERGRRNNCSSKSISNSDRVDMASSPRLKLREQSSFTSLHFAGIRRKEAARARPPLPMFEGLEGDVKDDHQKLPPPPPPEKDRQSFLQVPHTSLDEPNIEDISTNDKRSTVVVRGSWVDVQKDADKIKTMLNGGGWWSKLRSRQKSLFSKKGKKRQAHGDTTIEEVPKSWKSGSPAAASVKYIEPPKIDVAGPPHIPSQPALHSPITDVEVTEEPIKEATMQANKSMTASRGVLRPLQLPREEHMSTQAPPPCIAHPSRTVRHSRMKSSNMSISLPYRIHEPSTDSEQEKEELEAPRIPASDTNATQKTVSSSILYLDDNLQSTHLSPKSAGVQFPQLTPNKATDALLDFVRHYKSDSSVNVLSPARVSSAWEMPYQQQLAREEEALHLSPTARRARRTTCTTMETIMTYQSSLDSSIDGTSLAFRASWCSFDVPSNAAKGVCNRITSHSHDGEQTVGNLGPDNTTSELSGYSDTRADEVEESIIDMYKDESDRSSACQRDTLLEYVTRPEQVAVHALLPHSITVARVMLPDNSKAVMNTIRQYSAAGRRRPLSPHRKGYRTGTGRSAAKGKPKSPIKRAVAPPPTIRVNRPESDLTLSSLCASDSLSHVDEAEVQHAQVARKSFASVLDYATLASIGALPPDDRRGSGVQRMQPTSPIPWPSKSKRSPHTSPPPLNSPGSQIMSEWPSFAWSEGRRTSIGTAYTVPSPLSRSEVRSMKSRERLLSTALTVPRAVLPPSNSADSAAAIETMQASQDEFPDSAYTQDVMKLFQPPKTILQTKSFLRESEAVFMPLTDLLAGSKVVDVMEKRHLFSPSRSVAGRGHWRRFCLDGSPVAVARKMSLGCDKTFGVQSDESGAVASAWKTENEAGQDDVQEACLDESSIVYPSSMSSTQFTFPTQSSPIRRIGTVLGQGPGTLSRTSSCNSLTSSASSMFSWSPVARFLPFAAEGREAVHGDENKTKLSLKIVVQSPTTDGHGSPP